MGWRKKRARPVNGKESKDIVRCCYLRNLGKKWSIMTFTVVLWKYILFYVHDIDFFFVIVVGCIFLLLLCIFCLFYKCLSGRFGGHASHFFYCTVFYYCCCCCGTGMQYNGIPSTYSISCFFNWNSFLSLFLDVILKIKYLLPFFTQT